MSVQYLRREDGTLDQVRTMWNRGRGGVERQQEKQGWKTPELGLQVTAEDPPSFLALAGEGKEGSGLWPGSWEGAVSGAKALSHRCL